MVPYVVEPELCRELVRYYEARGGQDSGFMRDVNGKGVSMVNHSRNRRADCKITDADLIARTQERLMRRAGAAITQAVLVPGGGGERFTVPRLSARQAVRIHV